MTRLLANLVFLLVVSPLLVRVPSVYGSQSAVAQPVVTETSATNENQEHVDSQVAEEEVHESEEVESHDGGHGLINTVIFIGFFLIGAGLLQQFSNIFKFPFTVALLIAGLIAQYVLRMWNVSEIVALDAQVIFLILLPALLFGAAMHINLHQFRLQFKTISFFATFGLLVSVFVVGALVSYLIGLPVGPSLLFGALISATDPIAVLALFKTLGAPQRLALVADGESMFNDATAVVVFRVMSTIFVSGVSFVGQQWVKVAWDFAYVFFGSIALGAVIGYLLSVLLAKIKNDVAVETTLTLGTAFIAFAGAEHWFHLSGVIASVLAGLVVGNMGRSRISPAVEHFVHEFWDYIGFLAVSAVFFFATLHLDLTMFTDRPSRWMLAVLSVLIGRAVSVYMSGFITNTYGFFKEEPNVPLSWLHVLNWGGLRGVIPLVLVFTLPDSYPFKQDIFVFTFASLLFTLLVNGLTIELLLKKLGLHLPSKDLAIAKGQEKVLRYEQALDHLDHLPSGEFVSNLRTKMKKEVEGKLSNARSEVMSLMENASDVLKSVKLDTLKHERSWLETYFKSGYISETVFFEYDAELDIQQDSLEYSDIYVGRGVVGRNGEVKSRLTFQERMRAIQVRAKNWPIFSALLAHSEDQSIRDRYALVKVRLMIVKQVFAHLKELAKVAPKDKTLKSALTEVTRRYREHEGRNAKELSALEKKYSEVVGEYQDHLIHSLVYEAQASH